MADVPPQMDKAIVKLAEVIRAPLRYGVLEVADAIRNFVSEVRDPVVEDMGSADERVRTLEAEVAITQAALAGYLGLPLDTPMGVLLDTLRRHQRPEGDNS